MGGGLRRGMRPLLVVLLAMMFVPSPVHAASDVTVTLTINAAVTFPFDEPAFTTTCTVTVPAASTADAVLDGASCIDGWSSIDYGGSLGRYVTGFQEADASDSTDAGNPDSIRFICGGLQANPGGAVLYSFWGFSVDRQAAGVGVDNHVVADGEELQFHYIVDACPSVAYQAYILAGTWPEAPAEFEGNAMTASAAETEV